MSSFVGYSSSTGMASQLISDNLPPLFSCLSTDLTFGGSFISTDLASYLASDLATEIASGLATEIASVLTTDLGY